jgi:ubiquinone/menaquinone biosynthesis C-methylase UbiE
MGFFTIELAKLVGPRGKVVAVDLQPKMLEVLARRLNRAGLADRVSTRVATADSLGLADLEGTADLVLAFAMVHEVPDAERFFREAAAVLKPGGCLYLAEPRGHVPADAFAAELVQAKAAGLSPGEEPRVWRSHAALLKKAA